MYRSRIAPVVGRAARVALAAALAISLAACTSAQPAATADKTVEQPKQELILASTTSTQDSGLFDVLIPAFEKAFPQYQVKVIAVGTGEALKLGENKDADVLLVHAKVDEEKFVASGFGTERRDVMYNDFVLVGPKADPAGVGEATTSVGALRAIARYDISQVNGSGVLENGESAYPSAPFYSRGDGSGTHKKELRLWNAASISPTESIKTYQETGQGMGETLRIASEKGGYTLTDRATFLAMRDSLDLRVLFDKDASLRNQYGVIVVAGARNSAGADVFANWVTGTVAQKVIGEFGIVKYGQQLFVPNAQ